MKPSLARLARSARSGLARQIAEQAAANILVQALGAITTLSFVHLLPPREYALFGLCISTVSFISISSDLGLMASMSYFWRQEVAGGPSFADRYAAIRLVRRLLFALSGIGGLSMLGWIEARQQASPLAILLIGLLVLILSWSQINAQMIVLPLRLTQQLRRAYRVELAGALVRAILAVLAFLLALHHAWFPLLSLGAASITTWMLARKTVPAQVSERRKANAESLRSVFRYIIPTIPGTIVFATQDVFVYWLASLSGGALVVAQTFALGRLAAIFVTLNSIMMNVIIPRVVNLADDRHAHRNGLLSVLAIALFCAAFVGFAAALPGVILFVLGKSYASLGNELVLSLSAASFGLVGQALGNLSRTMGWVRWETPMIILHVLVIVALVPFFDFSTTHGVLEFNLLITVAGLLEMLSINAIGRLGIAKPASTPS